VSGGRNYCSCFLKRIYASVARLVNNAELHFKTHTRYIGHIGVAYTKSSLIKVYDTPMCPMYLCVLKDGKVFLLDTQLSSKHGLSML